ncbi:MAG: aspartate aminotransferase family protein [Frankiales bacterium]|nr:aspartate aminotransferase family protein [Frankiales bacterium]
MQTPDWPQVLDTAAARATRFLSSLPDRAVAAQLSREDLMKALSVPLAEDGVPAEDVIAELADALEPGMVASPGGRYFGFVIGGSVPAALGADWLVSTYDQNAGSAAVSPGSMVVEEVTAAWLLDVLRLPAESSTGFVTGGQAGNTVGLAAARHAVLRAAGHDVERDGLWGAPPVTVFVGADRHATVDRAVRFLGFGTAAVQAVASDDAGRMRPDALGAAMAARPGPSIVVAQYGEIHTGALDPIGELVDVAHAHGAWLHVDGAIGLWARASRALAIDDGCERADSWSADAHKWLNVPYDCGLVFCRDNAAHRASMSTAAAYLVSGAGIARDAFDWNPELSKRARAVPVYAALRSLGRAGLADIVDRTCAHARLFASLLGPAEGVRICNDVHLNQVTVRFGDGETGDEQTEEVVRRVQAGGTCWVGPSTWRGRRVMRISVVNWSTDTDDVERSAAAILTCWAAVRG